MTLSSRDKTLTMIAILLAVFLGALDQTIVSTALPKIASDLQGLSRYAWVVTAYLLASTVLVPIYGKLADRMPRKHLIVFAVATFLLGSFLCGIAGEFGSWPIIGDGMNQLIVFRAIQGIGGAGLFSLAFIVIADLYPARQRGRYQGFVGATFGVASVLGPWVGGVLTDHASGVIPGVEGWRWVFYVNLPFGALAMWFLLRRLPLLAPQGESEPLDYLSAAFLLLGLTPIVLAMQLDRATAPWSGLLTLGLVASGIVFLGLFIVRSLRSSNPVLDLTLFRVPVFRFSSIALVSLGATFLGILIFLPLFMVNVLGVSATQAGVSIIPLSLGAVFGSVASGQLAAIFGRYRPLMLGGAVILFGSLILLAQMPVDVSATTVTLYMVLAGLGVGPSLPLYTLAVQNAVPLQKLGQATSASQFFRQIGGTLGTAVLGGVLAASLSVSFAELTDSLSGSSGATSAQELVSLPSLESLRATGGAGFDESVRQGVLDAFDAVASDIEEGELERAIDVLQVLPLPEDLKRLEVDRIRSLAPEQVDALQTQATILRTIGVSAADEAAGRVQAILRGGFHEAITGIFRLLLMTVALGFIATLFVPALELASEAPRPASTSRR